MKNLLTFIRKLENFGAVLAALSLVVMAGLGFLEILMREVLGEGLTITLEYTGYLVALSFLLGSGWAFREGKHVRLSLFKPKKGQKTGFEALVLGIALVLAAMLAFGLISWAFGSLEQGSVSYFPSATPLWVPQALLSLGPLILFFSILGQLIETFWGKKP